MDLQPVVLAGGSGTRLWPLSREYHPKQFLPLMGGRTMLQETVARLDGMKGVAAPLIVCNEAHRFLVADQMREIGIGPQAIIVEPVGRNTAPALTLAALSLVETGKADGADPVVLSMHADHVIPETTPFQEAVRAALPLAAIGNIVTFGVVPSGPHTGYGYIRKGESLEEAQNGAHWVAAFVEKPDVDTARSYLETGEYLWNSGIFMMRASVWLSELERYRPDIAKACRSAQSNGHADGQLYRPGAADFVACPSDSIDYAVMEKAAGTEPAKASGKPGRRQPVAADPARCAVVPLNTRWSDIGAWSALWEEREHDSQGNVIQGDVYAHATRNTLLLAQSRLVASVGLEDMVVVETGDAVLVARKDSVQDVKEIVQRLKADERTERETQRKVHRPWGSYEVLDAGEGFQVKRLTLNPGGAVSLQMHHHRAEHWVVVAGTARVTKGDEVFMLQENQSTYVPKGVTHRLENPGDLPLEIIEVESGTYLGEDDIVRFEDKYDRHKPS